MKLLIYVILAAVGFYFGYWGGALTSVAVFYFVNHSRLAMSPFASKNPNIECLFYLLGFAKSYIKKHSARGQTSTAEQDTVIQTLFHTYQQQIPEKHLRNWFAKGMSLSQSQLKHYLDNVLALSSLQTRQLFFQYLYVLFCASPLSIAVTLRNDEKAWRREPFLSALAKRLKLSVAEVEQICHDFLHSQQHGEGQSSSRVDTETLAHCYKVLGVCHDVDNKTLIKIRRQLLNRYHPDKLGKQDGETIRQAESQINKINKAFSIIKERRGF